MPKPKVAQQTLNGVQTEAESHVWLEGDVLVIPSDDPWCKARVNVAELVAALRQARPQLF